MPSDGGEDGRMRRALAGLAFAATLVPFVACLPDEGAPSNEVRPPPPPDAAATSNLLPNAAACTSASQCQSQQCFIGGQQSFCTVACTPANQTTVCAAPFSGTCNKQGYCKRP